MSLDVRNRRREAQRTIRLALNGINASLDAWKTAIQEGKRAAVNLTNAILTLEHLRALPLGVLADIPGLRQKAASASLLHLNLHLESLVASLTSLDDAVRGLSAASAPVAALNLEEEREGLLRGGTVFTALPFPTIGSILHQIDRMYEAELVVKRAVVSDCVNICTLAQQRHSESSTSASPLRWQLGSVILTSIDELQAFLQTHITAWMLCVEVTEAQVDADLAMITQDANSC